MVNLPWRRDSDDDPDDERLVDDPDAIVACRFQDGTLAVYEDHVVIERADRSEFEDKRIPATEIISVEYESGITIGYIQIEQTGIPVDSGGLLSDPVNQNTLHFGRGDRDCAKEARDAILERARG